MNILIPDSWLREYLHTDATPSEIKEYVSLCGPSIERMNTVGKEIVYDIEVTTNRVDSYSVAGIAREAAAILPRFGKKAEFIPVKHSEMQYPKKPLGITIEDTGKFCRRILAVKIEGITLAPSPKNISSRLELVGQRPLNNIVDITNYVMWETGHPSHAFDYDRLAEKKIIIREAKKGEIVISLDEKRHTMTGGELVFDDGTGTIIDLPGVMGTANSVVTEDTKNVLLFIENSQPEKIRFTSMSHAIRTQAAVINEKDPDPELAYTAMNRAVSLAVSLTKGTIGSALLDRYPSKFTPYTVTVSREKVKAYIGTEIPDSDIHHILSTLGFATRLTKHDITVTVPSFRRDVSIDVDIIEEIARIYGYHAIETHLPSQEPPVVLPSPLLVWEETIKTRLRDLGFTEMYTYSMISEKLMKTYGQPEDRAYKIANPLTEDWVYMRPNIIMSALDAFRQNINTANSLRVFELSNAYVYRAGELPLETPVLELLWPGDVFLEAKGMAEFILKLFGIPCEFTAVTDRELQSWYTAKSRLVGAYGTVGVLHRELLERAGIHMPVTRLSLRFDALVSDAKPTAVYTPISKFPPAIEDLAFIVPAEFQVGPFMQALSEAHPLVSSVTFLDSHEQTRTVRVAYQDPTKNLTTADIRPVREQLIALARKKFSADLKNI